MNISQQIINYLQSIGARYQVVGFPGTLFVEYNNRSVTVERINNVRYSVMDYNIRTAVLGADSVIDFLEGRFF